MHAMLKACTFATCAIFTVPMEKISGSRTSLAKAAHSRGSKFAPASEPTQEKHFDVAENWSVDSVQHNRREIQDDGKLTIRRGD